MKKHISLFLLLIFMGASKYSFAVDYYWTANFSGPAVHYSSASAACSAYQTVTNGDGTKFSPNGFIFVNGGAGATCLQKRTNASGTSSNTASYLGYSATRYGTTCPNGGIYDPTTGGCDIPPCPVGQIRDTMTGQCIPEPSQCKSKIGQAHQMWVDTFNFEMCISGCSVAVENAIPVKRLIGPGVSYDVDAVFTGEDCSGDTQTTCSGECDISKPTESDTETECTATTTDGEGRQVSNCQTTDTMKDNQDCVAKGGSLGSMQGMQVCVAANKGPKATQTVKDVKQTTETTPSGGTKTTTETTTTTTNCVGTKACTSTSTTVTNNTSTNANGTPGSGSSSCKGDNCGSGGKESTTPGKEETEEEGIPGPTKTIAPKESTGFGNTGKEWDDKIAAGRELLDAKIDQYSNLFSGAFDLNIGTGGGQLPCYKIPINAPYIHTTLDFCPANFEDQLVYLKYILLACATILAGFFILRD